MKSKLLTIGELSKRTGCSIKALRYYDLIGLLKPIYVDPNSNYRYYNFEQTRMVELIQICINLSIPLKEVKDLVFKDNNKIDYIQLIEYGKKITEEKNIGSDRGRVRGKCGSYWKNYKRNAIVHC